MIFNFSELLINIQASILRVLCGGSLAIICGIIFGLLRFQLPLFLKRNFIFNFLLDSFKFPPPLAYIPFVILFIGIGFKASIAIVFIGVFPAIATNTYEALSLIPKEINHTMNSLQLNAFDRLFKIQLPAILPQIFTGIRVGFAMGWMSIIAAEMISGDKGLGYSLQMNRINLNLNAMIIDMIAIAFIGFFINFTLKFIEKRIIRWKH